MKVRQFLDYLNRLARAAPGEVGLVALLGAIVIGASVFAWVQTSDRPELPIEREVADEQTAEPVMLTIHVAGEVASPGVYELPEGSRIQDAIEAAGGALKTGDVDALNLAEMLSDGQKVVVPKPGEAVSTGTSSQISGKVNLNTASQAQLEELPGVGPVLAQRIMEFRERKRFTSIRQLLEVSGIGPKKYESLKDLVTI